VLEHGYGYADTKTHALVQPTSRFRLASVTKNLTDAAIGVLIHEHKLSFDTRPFATILRGLRAPGGRPPVDPRVEKITIADLVNMKGGWDISKLGFDPAFDAGPEERALHLHSPPTCEQSIEYMLGKRLNHAPGTDYVYSNFGYCVLGDVIAHVMHTTYQRALSELVLSPAGMTATEPSLADPADLLPGEVHYYGQGSEATGSQSPSRLALGASLGAAGMVSTAVDLERFLIVLGGAVPGSTPWPVPGGNPFIGILGPPPVETGVTWEWDGSLPGTSTSMIIEGPASVVFLTNTRSSTGPMFKVFHTLAKQQTSWPAGNLLAPPAP
jgi:CubicO group peptidase (beta-lactamase class C family)